MFIQFWMQCQCPGCKKWNWLYNGHDQDDGTSGNDNFAIKCWNCGESHWTSDFAEEAADSMYGIAQTAEEVAELGREKPE